MLKDCYIDASGGGGTQKSRAEDWGAGWRWSELGFHLKLETRFRKNQPRSHLRKPFLLPITPADSFSRGTLFGQNAHPHRLVSLGGGSVVIGCHQRGRRRVNFTLITFECPKKMSTSKLKIRRFYFNR